MKIGSWLISFTSFLLKININIHAPFIQNSLLGQRQRVVAGSIGTKNLPTYLHRRRLLHQILKIIPIVHQWVTAHIPIRSTYSPNYKAVPSYPNINSSSVPPICPVSSSAPLSHLQLEIHLSSYRMNRNGRVCCCCPLSFEECIRKYHHWMLQGCCRPRIESRSW